MIEIWKDIEGYEGLYQISNMGNVMSLGNGKSNASIRKLLKPYKTGHYRNYLCVKLLKNGIQKQYRIHKLVAEAFIPNPNHLPQVNHKDEDTLNNCVENLEWCDAKYNSNYGSRTKRQSKKMVNNPKISKKVNQYTLDGEFVRDWPSVSEIERCLGFSTALISACCNGKYKQLYGFIWCYASDIA